MRLPKAWKGHRRMRDNHPALVDTEIRETSILRARFAKAVVMADVLMRQQATADEVRQLDGEAWTTVEVLAGETSSSVTRALVVLILEDREKQMEGLMNELDRIDLLRRPPGLTPQSTST